MLSVLKQTFTDFEIIIVDDASTDGSYEKVVELFSLDERVQLIQLPENKGVSAARNKGLELASGRYIAFLDADDVWIENKLEKQVAFMKQTGAPVCHTVYAYMNEDNQILSYTRVRCGKVSLKEVMKNTEIGLSTSMVDHLAVGDFSFSQSSSREDLLLWLSLFHKGFYSLAINEPLVCYRVRKGQRSANKILMAFETWKVYMRFKPLSLEKKFFYFLMYAVNGCRKHLRI